MYLTEKGFYGSHIGPDNTRPLRIWSEEIKEGGSLLPFIQTKIPRRSPWKMIPSAADDYALMYETTVGGYDQGTAAYRGL